MIILLFLLIILYIHYKVNKKKELFKNYRGIVIKPKKFIYLPNKIILKDDILSTHIYQKIIQLFPLERYDNNSEDLIEIVNKNDNFLGITDFYTYFNFILDNPENNIRFVCNILGNKLTIFKHNNSIAYKKICIEFKKSPEYYILNTVSKYVPLNLVILNKSVDINLLDKILFDNNCNHFAKFMNHPDEKLRQILKINDNLRILDFKDDDLFSSIIPNFNKTKINMNDYEMLSSIDSIINNKVIICNVNSDSNMIYSILDLIYNNFNDFKNSDDFNLKKSLQYYQINDIFASDIPTIKLHKGVDLYLRDKGYLSSKDKNICRKFVGIGTCPDNLRLNPYRLL